MNADAAPATNALDATSALHAVDAGPTFAQFFDAWELFRTSTLAGALAGFLLGFLGVYIVLRRMVFLSAALSQAATLGVALTLLVDTRAPALAPFAPPAAGGTLFTFLAALPFFGRGAARSVGRESAMGWLWVVGAAGALAVGALIVDAEDIHGILFGSAVVVSEEQLMSLSVLGVVVTALHIWWRRAFVQVSLDPDGARVRHVPVRVIDAALLATLALAVSASTRVLGALPVFAFSILPAMAALRVMATVPRALVVAALVGAASGFVGYVLAFRYALPVGAAQALVAAGFVVVAELVARARVRSRAR